MSDRSKIEWTDVQLRPDKLDQPLRWRRPRRVFVNSMSDLFHADIPDEYIARVFAVMALTPQHTYQVLTKRHGRMRSLLSSPAFEDQVRAVAGVEFGLDYHGAWPLPNVWLGVSVEDQSRANLRVPVLLTTPAAVRFLSCEPILGPVNLTYMDVERHTEGMYVINALTGANKDMGRPCADVNKVDWVIAGGESGKDARPMHPDWARSLRDQCQEAGVPFLFKQWGEWAPEASTPIRDRPVRVVSRDGREPALVGTAMRMVGKRTTGRELDGRTWDEYPEVRS